MAVDPNRFDEFVIESMIGEGGMGKVYRARQTALDRWVALKVLPRAKENPSFIERFYREARSAARLIHPNIVQIYTVGELQGVPYFTMEYVEGVDLEHIVHDRLHPLTRDEIVEIARSVIKAMAVASEQGVVHRDIKPANIMVSKTGLIKVMDFGLAKEMDHNITQSGVVVGTPTYMSPEQGSGATVDFRSDMYSLGCVLYEIIKGHPPFTAEKVAAVIYKHMFELPAPINSPETPVDQLLEEFILKLLKKKPEDRYQTPLEALDCLSQIYCNHAAAELGLARHAMRHFKARKAKEAEQVIANDPDFAKMQLPPSAQPKGQPSPPDETHPHNKTSDLHVPVQAHADIKAELKAPELPQKAEMIPLPGAAELAEKREPNTALPASTVPAEGIPAPYVSGLIPRAKFLKVQRPTRPLTPDPDYAPIRTPVDGKSPADGKPGTDKLPPLKSDKLPPLKTDKLPPLKSDNLPTLKTDKLPAMKTDKLPSLKATGPASQDDDIRRLVKPAVPPKPLNMLKPPPRRGSGLIDGKRPSSADATKEPSSILSEAEVVTRETAAPVMRIQHHPEQMSHCFSKLNDGRWSYSKLHTRCEKSEGLARIIPAPATPPGTDRGLGDCLLCPNWNHKLGCAQAHNEELAVKNRFSGLKLLSEQATAWMGAGRFDKAIGLLNEFIEDNPDSTDGYRELARIYDRPDYKGRDKRRGIIMYMRFIDLARAGGSYSQIEISRAEARALALKNGPVASGNLTPGESLEFDCFYRGVSDCYVACRADSQRIVAVKIGLVDPFTGHSDPDPGASTSTFKRAVSMFSRAKTDQEKEEEQTAVRKELARLKDLDIAYVLKEPAIVCTLNYDALGPLEEKLLPPDISILRLKERSTTHNFIFLTRNQFEGQQLRELLIRKLGRKQN